ncbi:tetratricopeptide repeat protein [Methylobacterium persicinum]
MAGDSDGAEEVASRLLNRHPDSAGGFGLLGLVALARDDRPSAIAAFRQALARQPEDPAILRNLSACCLQEGDAAEALALAERAHLAAPST